MKQALLIIDNRNVQQAIEGIFEQAFFNSMSYHSIATPELLSTLDEFVPDIIVLLVAEEGRKLMDIIRIIRRKAAHEHTPIMVMGETDDIVDVLLDIGATVVLGAIFSQSELTSRVEHLLGMRV